MNDKNEHENRTHDSIMIVSVSCYDMLARWIDGRTNAIGRTKLITMVRSPLADDEAGDLDIPAVLRNEGAGAKAAVDTAAMTARSRLSRTDKRAIVAVGCCDVFVTNERSEKNRSSVHVPTY